MNAKEFKKAQKIFSQIEALDVQIISLDKLAINIINEKVEKINVSISWDNVKEDEGVKFDEDGSIVSGDAAQSLYSMYHAHKVITWGAVGGMEKILNDQQLKFNMNEIDSLDLIGGMIAMKKQQRELLIKQLNKKGVDL